MKLGLGLAAMAVLVAAVPSSTLACEAPGPCPLVDVCDGPDCDAAADPAPAAPPARRCEAPGCDAPVDAACEGPGCDAPSVKRAEAPAGPGPSQ
jgi:hypothetical protein